MKFQKIEIQVYHFQYLLLLRLLMYGSHYTLKITVKESYNLIPKKMIIFTTCNHIDKFRNIILIVCAHDKLKWTRSILNNNQKEVTFITVRNSLGQGC